MPKEMTIEQLLDAVYQDEIEDSQDETHFHVNGVPFARIRFGGEARYMEFLGEPDYTHCGDCAVALGQIHVRGCDIEECPKCHRQLLSCGCQFDEDEEA
jgi:hypothetical protein